MSTNSKTFTFTALENTPGTVKIPRKLLCVGLMFRVMYQNHSILWIDILFDICYTNNHLTLMWREQNSKFSMKNNSFFFNTRITDEKNKNTIFFLLFILFFCFTFSVLRTSSSVAGRLLRLEQSKLARLNFCRQVRKWKYRWGVTNELKFLTEMKCWAIWSTENLAIKNSNI